MTLGAAEAVTESIIRLTYVPEPTSPHLMPKRHLGLKDDEKAILQLREY